VQFHQHHAMDGQDTQTQFIEFYQFLINCFVRADTNLDGQVSED